MMTTPMIKECLTSCYSNNNNLSFKLLFMDAYYFFDIMLYMHFLHNNPIGWVVIAIVLIL